MPGPAHYLQQGQSESCSDPDSSPFALKVWIIPTKIVLWRETDARAATKDRSSSTTCGKPGTLPQTPPCPSSTCIQTHHHKAYTLFFFLFVLRVVRCRARGSEPSKIVHEEMFVTEQVEVEQDGDTCVEVCTVSRGCSRSEVVAIDKKSVAEEEVMMEDDERPLSVISCSSHVLQSLKEDQDDELPPSASQCCCSIEPSPTHKEDEEEGRAEQQPPLTVEQTPPIQQLTIEPQAPSPKGVEHLTGLVKTRSQTQRKRRMQK
ncbi:hypothetical protein F7725_008991 [Dissostichus mawsoni]|uniref:Uncharacterized protein n=1 Tax=Dissostichus mawsoni TaxID=36200 RepID=A0A7J5Z5P1_DISMA|nr:hypothetical protein F7725_008991 [Dissostichus mawsoni]